jgi:hypothetical protein
MRIAFALIAAFLMVLAGPAFGKIELSSPEDALGWIKGYREQPHPDAVPGLVRELAAVGAFQEPEGAGVYVGFMAGVIGANPGRAEKLIAGMAKIPEADQWAVIKAIAYSRLGGWRHLLAVASADLPTRGTMIDAYLTGKLPGFDSYRLKAEDPSMLERAGQMVGWGEKDETVYLEPSPAMLDTFWGYYFATGSLQPLRDIADLVGWSAEGNDLARLTIGSSAKYSLAANASRDALLLAAVREVRTGVTDAELGAQLDEAIFAAEVSETDKLRLEAAESIALLREKGPAYLRKVAWWGKAGEGAIALGCVAAAVTGQHYLGIPCVVGGAVTSAVLRYLGRES